MKYVFVRFCVARILCIYLSLYIIHCYYLSFICHYTLHHGAISKAKRCDCLISFFSLHATVQRKNGLQCVKGKRNKTKTSTTDSPTSNSFSAHTFLFQSSPFYFESHTFNNLPTHIRLINTLLELKRKAQQHILSYSCPCTRHLNEHRLHTTNSATPSSHSITASHSLSLPLSLSLSLSLSFKAPAFLQAQ